MREQMIAGEPGDLVPGGVEAATRRVTPGPRCSIGCAFRLEDQVTGSIERVAGVGPQAFERDTYGPLGRAQAVPYAAPDRGFG